MKCLWYRSATRWLCATCVVASSSSALAQTTVSFQQGVNGYAGTTDVIIGVDIGAKDGNVIGSAVQEIFLDGQYHEVTAVADEKQMLLKFDEIFGAGAGQIPLGAKILDAKLKITTGESSGNARTGGPFGVAQLLVPFDATTTFNSMSAAGTGGSGGATYAGGQIARPLDKGYRGPIEATTPNGLITTAADVTSVLQNWSKGAANNGFAVVAGTTDGWQVFTSGVVLPAGRPSLEVTYDVSPQPTVSTVTLQNGLNGYAGTTMVRMLQSGVTEDGLNLDEAFLDGGNITGTSPNDQALIKFANIFASQGGSVPDNATILDAHLVLDSGRAAFSTNAGTNGNFGVARMLKDWSLTSVYTDYGADGPSSADGDTGSFLDTTGAMIADAQATLDVTEAVQAWQGGSSNFGLNVRAVDTTDGWAINFTGSADPSAVPRLVINYTTDVIAPTEDADFDADGDVDGADFLAWQQNFGAGSTLAQGDANGDNAVNDADLTIWKQQFGGVASAVTANAVPEPTALVLAMGSLAIVGAWGERRR